MAFSNGRYGDYHQHKRARTDHQSAYTLNGHHSATEYEQYKRNERGLPTYLPLSEVPSSSRSHPFASVAEQRDDPPRPLRMKLKMADSQQSDPSSHAPDKLSQSIIIKREPQEPGPSILRTPFVKEEPHEPTLSYDEPEETDGYTLPCRRSAAPSPSTASAFSDNFPSNAISTAVDTAVTSVQEDRMDSASVESAIQSVQSSHGQMNVATTSAVLPGASEVNGIVGPSSTSSEMQPGMTRVKLETTDVMERARREMLLRASARTQAQTELQQPDQDPLRQAATYSTVLDSTARTSTLAEPPSTSNLKASEGTILQSSPNEKPADESQIASTSALPPQETSSHADQPPSDNQPLPSFNVPVQDFIEAGPSTVTNNNHIQNVNPRLISPLPQRALRSCISTETQRQREKRRVTFNTQAKDDKGGIWPTKVN